MRKKSIVPIRGVAAWLSCVALMTLFGAAAKGCRAPDAQKEPPDSRTITVYDRDSARMLTMPLEQYLVSVVGAEMPASFPLEALKAQAVAARTYSVRRIMGMGGSRCENGADVCTDSGCCQAYSPVDELAERFGEDAARYMDKLEEAVYSTAGETATYRGEPIEALYHSAAGGRTEDAQNVFSSALPYLVGVESPGEEGAAKYRERYNYSKKEFARTVNARYKGAKLDAKKLQDQIEILSRYDSGQVKELRLGGAVISGREMRKLFDLNSANFTIEIEDGVTITTTGYGHGVGMSQYGARAMALEGADYREILTHYYTGVEITK